MKDSSSLALFLLQARFGWVSLDFNDLVVRNADLSEVKFLEAKFSNITFINCIFSDVQMWECEFHHVIFEQCHMPRTKFYRVKFWDVQFLRTSCSDAVWREIEFKQIKADEWRTLLSDWVDVHIYGGIIRFWHGTGLEFKKVSLNNLKVESGEYVCASWDEVQFQSSKFYCCRFRHIRLLGRGSFFIKSEFYRSNFTYLEARDFKLMDVKLIGCCIKDSEFKQVFFEGFEISRGFIERTLLETTKKKREVFRKILFRSRRVG